MKRLGGLGAGLALLAGLAAFGAGPAVAQNDFYKDKVINFVVHGSPAGGHTRHARMIAPYIQKHTGAREVRITNLQGGGGLKGANSLWREKTDGYTIALSSIPTLILAPLAGSAGAQFDATKFTYIARVTSEPRVLTVGGKSPLKTIDDLKKLNRPFVFPSQGTDEDFYTMAVLFDALGLPIKMVTGYEGNADTALAVIKGDGDGHITSWSQTVGAIASGDKRPFLVVGSERIPEAPDVPTVFEVTPREKHASLRAIINTVDLHRCIIGPPNMDPKAVAALRTLVMAAMNDPELKAESLKSKMPLTPLDGAKVTAMVNEVAKASGSLSPILKAAVKTIQ